MTYGGETPEYAKHEEKLPLKAGEKGIRSLWSIRRRLIRLSSGANGRVADGEDSGDYP